MARPPRPILRATFVRERGKRDRVHVVRSDGTAVSWAFPTYGDGLPHDLVHLVVEAAFGLRHGFWGRIDVGVDPDRVNVEAARKVGANRYVGFGEDRRELLQAEALAAEHWYDPDVSDAAVCESLVERAAEFGVEPPAATPERVAAARRALRTLRSRWRLLEDRQALDLAFWPDDPEAGLEASSGCE